MMNTATRSQLARVLLVVGPLVTLAVTPWMSYDPINLPKFSLLLAGAGIALGLLILDIKALTDARYRATIVVSALFKLDMLLVLITSASPFNQQFFGTNGRNTGYLAYVSLLILFFAAVVSLDIGRSEKLLWSLFWVGAISAVYGLAQSVGWDLINWNNPYAPVIGFLGNPDFQSSFLGIGGVVAVAFLFKVKSSWPIRSFLISYLLLALYVMSKTKAVQGFLVLAVGVVVVLYLYIRNHRRLKALGIPYLLLSVMAGVIVIVSSLNKGAVGPLLVQIVDYLPWRLLACGMEDDY